MKDIAGGTAVDDVYLVGEKHLRANRSGGLYLQLKLCDKTGSIDACLWNATESLFRSIDVNDFVHVQGRAQWYQGSLQLILSKLKRVRPDEVNIDEFVPRTERDVSRLICRLRELLDGIEEPALKALATSFLEDEHFMSGFSSAPAATRHHHAYLGGLLEHTVQVMELAGRVCDLYPFLNRDLLLMGAFLHDVGKMHELSYKRAFQYTDDGQLLGHIVIGLSMLERKAEEAAQLLGQEFPSMLLTQLKHLIASHHGALERGSPVVPMTLEALVLHRLDELDARIGTFLTEVKSDPDRESRWTPYLPSWGCKLLKNSADCESSGAGQAPYDFKEGSQSCP